MRRGGARTRGSVARARRRWLLRDHTPAIQEKRRRRCLGGEGEREVRGRIEWSGVHMHTSLVYYFLKLFSFKDTLSVYYPNKLKYSLRPKINATIEFKIYPKKLANFDLPTTQYKIIPEDSHKKQLTTHSLFTKYKG